MSIHIKPGNNVLTFYSLTPANFGTQWGTIYVDSPTQIDEQYGLPYIPNSALKGILRSNIELTKKNANLIKKHHFGTPDGPIEKEKFGSEGKIIFGNAYPVIFPFKFLNREKAFIVPIVNLYYLNNFISFIAIDSKVNDLFKTIISEDKNRNIFCLNSFNILSDFKINLYPYRVPSETIEEILKILSKLTSSNFIENKNFILAGPKMSKLLWQKSSELRYQIEINGKKITKDGSLRTIELIPEETLFASVISNFSNHKFPIIDPIISIGAWEKYGFGWFLLNRFSRTDIILNDNQFHSDKIKINTVIDSEIMTNIYRAIFTKELPESKKILTIAQNFGIYLHKYGIEAALFFELAKAKAYKKSNSAETLSHRWLLAQLMEMETDIENASEIKKIAKKITNKIPSISEEETIKMAKIVSWIKRFLWLKIKIYEES